MHSNAKRKGERMNDKDKALAYKLHLQKWSYVQIAARLEVNPGAVKLAVVEADRAQKKLCVRCQWRRDGAMLCMLPTCMHELGKQKRKRRGRVWRWRKS